LDDITPLEFLNAYWSQDMHEAAAASSHCGDKWSNRRDGAPEYSSCGTPSLVATVMRDEINILDLMSILGGNARNGSEQFQSRAFKV